MPVSLFYSCHQRIGLTIASAQDVLRICSELGRVDVPLLAVRRPPEVLVTVFSLFLQVFFVFCQLTLESKLDCGPCVVNGSKTVKFTAKNIGSSATFFLHASTLSKDGCNFVIFTGSILFLDKQSSSSELGNLVQLISLCCFCHTLCF